MVEVGPHEDNEVQRLGGDHEEAHPRHPLATLALSFLIARVRITIESKRRQKSSIRKSHCASESRTMYFHFLLEMIVSVT